MGHVSHPLFLINGRPPQSPHSVPGAPGKRIRLRVINAAADTVFAFFDRNPPDKNFVAGQDSLYASPLVISRKEKITSQVPVGYPTVITFRGDGSASASGKIALTLKTFMDTLDILASTGRVKVTKH